MMNTDQDQASADQNAALHPILQSGPRGAIVLSGLATAVVVALWLAFYFLVFLPRGMAS